jgi:hypothetical protein
MAKLPPEILNALRTGRRDATDPARLDALATRIQDAASSVLTERLSGRAAERWWDLPSAWAATLIPASLALAAVSLLVLWRVTPPQPVMDVSDATVLRAAVPISSPAAVDQALNELVDPQARPRR